MPPRPVKSPRRRRGPRRLAAILIAASAASAAGGPVHAQAVAPPLWVSDSIRSEVLGETRQLRIALPPGYDARQHAAERYPVLITLDAQVPGHLLNPTVAMVRALAGETPALPHLIVVGVETPDPRRFRDLTPPLVGEFRPRDGGPAPGGGPAFLRFLSTELRPYLAARYRTLPTTVLAGHSLGGAFTAWAFGQAPDFLAGAIALSPTPAWLNADGLGGRHALDGILARTAPGRLFVANGTAEVSLDSAVQSFVSAVKSRPASGWVVEYQRIPGAAHFVTAPLGMVPGLLFVFRPVSLAGFQLDYAAGMPALIAAFDSTREAYARGARELGLPPRLPLAFLNGQRWWHQNPRADSAGLSLRVCQELIVAYPALWHGHECAGDTHRRLRRSAEAAEHYRRAVEAARSAGDSATVDRLTRKTAGRP
jgi:uncharacterized protein